MQTFKEFTDILGSPSQKSLKKLDKKLAELLNPYHYQSRITDGKLYAVVKDEKINSNQFQQVIRAAMRQVNFVGSADFRNMNAAEGHLTVWITPKK